MLRTPDGNGHAVELESVSFAYNGTAALEDVSFTVGRREMVSVVGPNGGGKTTLLKLMLGILKPDTGRVRLFGRAPERVLPLVGYMPQHLHFDRLLPVTALDVVLMGRLTSLPGWYSRREKEAAMEALEETGLAEHAGRPFAALSGGQQQRVLLARAICSRPQLLLLDEPTANVDANFGNRLFDLLRRLGEQMSVVMITHDMGFVSSVFSKVICVNRVVCAHPTSEITPAILEDLYQGSIRIVRHDHVGNRERRDG